MIEGPKNKKISGNWGGRAQYSSVSPPDRAAPRGSNSGIGLGAARVYAITRRQEEENSPDVVTGMLLFFCINVFALLHPSSILYFVTH